MNKKKTHGHQTAPYPFSYLRLVRFIMAYESDTFSASGNKVTKKNAQKIADKIIKDAIDGIDGIAVRGYLDEVRRR